MTASSYRIRASRSLYINSLGERASEAKGSFKLEKKRVEAVEKMMTEATIHLN